MSKNTRIGSRERRRLRRERERPREHTAGCVWKDGPTVLDREHPGPCSDQPGEWWQYMFGGERAKDT